MPIQWMKRAVGDFGLVGPGADKIDEFVAGVVGDPDAWLEFPKLFF